MSSLPAAFGQRNIRGLDVRLGSAFIAPASFRGQLWAYLFSPEGRVGRLDYWLVSLVEILGAILRLSAADPGR